MAARTSKPAAPWQVAPEHEEAWLDEIERRRELALSGEVKLLSLEDAIARLRKPRP